MRIINNRNMYNIYKRDAYNNHNSDVYNLFLTVMCIIYTTVMCILFISDRNNICLTIIFEVFITPIVVFCPFKLIFPDISYLRIYILQNVIYLYKEKTYYHV